MIQLYNLRPQRKVNARESYCSISETLSRNVNATNNIRRFGIAYLVECVERLAVDLANTKSICVFKAKKKRIYSPRHIKGHSTEPKSADKKEQVR